MMRARSDARSTSGASGPDKPALRPGPRLPFSTPAWITPARIALAAVAVAAAAAALPAVWWIGEARSEIGKSGGAIAVMAGTTTGLSLLLFRIALRRRNVGNAVLWCVLGGIVAGVLNAGLSLGGVELVRRADPASAAGGLVLGILIGGFYGGPLGLIFGTAYAPLAASAVRARLEPSHDALDRVLLATGCWLAFAGEALSHCMGESPRLIPPALLLGGGVGLAILGGARLWARHRWLERVAAGHDPVWRIAPRRGEDDEAALVPVVRVDAPLEGVLLRRAPAGDPYRTADAGVPAALAALPELAPGGARGVRAAAARAVHGAIQLFGAVTLRVALTLLAVAFCVIAIGVPVIALLGACTGVANLQ